MFITTMKPYHDITANTAARWVKDVLRLSGIDITRYGAGSTRSASTSKAQAQGAPIELIMEAAGWATKSTFACFYDKKIMKDKDLSEFVLK